MLTRWTSSMRGAWQPLPSTLQPDLTANCCRVGVRERGAIMRTRRTRWTSRPSCPTLPPCTNVDMGGHQANQSIQPITPHFCMCRQGMRVCACGADFNMCVNAYMHAMCMKSVSHSSFLLVPPFEPPTVQTNSHPITIMMTGVMTNER